MKEIKFFQIALKNEMKYAKLPSEKVRWLWNSIMIKIRKQTNEGE